MSCPIGVIVMARVPRPPPLPPLKVRAKHSPQTSWETGSSKTQRETVEEASPKP